MRWMLISTGRLWGEGCISQEQLGFGIEFQVVWSSSLREEEVTSKLLDTELGILTYSEP